MGIRPCQSPVGSLDVREEMKEELGGILLPGGAELSVTPANQCLEHDGPNTLLTLVSGDGK